MHSATNICQSPPFPSDILCNQLLENYCIKAFSTQMALDISRAKETYQKEEKKKKKLLAFTLTCFQIPGFPLDFLYIYIFPPPRPFN